MNPSMWDPTLGVIILANAVVILIISLGRNDKTNWRIPICISCAIAILAYLYWRSYYIVSGIGGGEINAIEGTLTILLLIFELINFTDFFIFLLTMARFKTRSPEADKAQQKLENSGEWPNVDVLIATYNEDWNILKKTIIAVKALDYPNMQGYILDDGKRDWLKTKCAEVGIGYIRRPGNAHKKPGNHNYALHHTNAPYIAMFDADFIPLPHFLKRLVPLLVANPNWGILQSPQTFYNPDPMRNNLKLQQCLPDDTSMFFTVMAPCRDAWGTAFYVGSSAILRRNAIEAIGGIVMGYDTEDQITSIALLQNGYKTGFLNETLSIGLAPESLSALIEQRKRWARGSIQILFSKHGPFGPNLSPKQRIMFCQSFWLIGFIAPIVYACIPAAMWVFQLRLFPYMPPEEVLYLPLFLFSCISLSIWWLSRGLWYPIISPALQLLLSIEVLPTIVTTLIKPFGEPLLKYTHVTPKGKQDQQEHVNWKSLRWLLAIILLTLGGLLFYLTDDFQFINHPDEMGAAVLWTSINLVIIALAALGCINITYQRGEERFHIKLLGHIGNLEFKTSNISLNGALIITKNSVPETGTLSLKNIGEIQYKKIREIEKATAIQFTELAPEVYEKLFKAIFLTKEHHNEELQGPLTTYAKAGKRIIS